GVCGEGEWGGEVLRGDMRGIRWLGKGGVLLLAGLVALASVSVLARQGARAPAGGSLGEAIPPHFEADPSWLQPLPPGTSLPELKPLGYGRPSVSVATDPRDHVWILQVPAPE